MKMPWTTALVCVAAVALAATTACGNGQPAPADKPAMWSDPDDDAASVEPSEDDYYPIEDDGEPEAGEGELGEGKGARTNVTDMHLALATSFSEGYAWVGFEDATGDFGGEIDSRVMSLIDTQGSIAYSTTDPVYATSSVVNGMTFVVRQTETFGDGPGYDFMIINTEGEELYSNAGTNTEAESTYILDSNGDNFVVAKYVSTFDEKTLYVGCIDATGKMVADYQALYQDDADNILFFLDRLYTKDAGVKDLGENMFFFRAESIWSKALYDIEANQVNIADTYANYLGMHNNNLYLSVFGQVAFAGSADKLYVVPRADFASVTNPVNGVVVDVEPLFLADRRNASWVGFSDGYYTNGLITYGPDGTELFKDDSGKDYHYGTMTDGLALLSLTGSDGKFYVTMVDAKGTKQFEPISVDTLAGQGIFGVDDADTTELSEGAVVAKKDGNYVVIDAKGTVTTLPVPENGDNGVEIEPVHDGLVSICVAYVDCGYLGIDGTTKIGDL